MCIRDRNLVGLNDVNAMSREQFVETFGGLFQGPRWVVERAYDERPFADTRDLRRAFQDALLVANKDEQRELFAAYPELGSDVVASGEAGQGSFGDQSALGLTRLDDEAHGELAALARDYRERFGFPLIISVRDRSSFEQILQHGRHRLDNSPTQEHALALIEIANIAGHRFDDLVADANPIYTARRRGLADA